MPEPSTTEGRRIQGELKNLLEDVAVRRAESSASRRQGYPPEHRAATSRFMRDASVHTEHTRNTAPARAGQKTRNPKPEPGIPEPEPEIPETRILFGNFG
jgi:hypothetical protein